MSSTSSTITVSVIGDIVGDPGLQALNEHLPTLRSEWSPDFIVVNAENVYEGKGIRPGDAKVVFDAGADVITTGNHVWERWQSKKVLAENHDVLRPYNYPPGNVGNGYVVKKHGDTNVAVINLQGRTFMQDIDCPFRAADHILTKLPADAIVIVDFHAEASAEKLALARHLDGRVSLIVGTHTHVPTSDAQILDGGTAYISDLGMTGPYDSVIGMRNEPAVNRFLYKTPFKYEVAANQKRMCGVVATIDRSSRSAVSIDQVILPAFRRSS